MFVDKEYRWGLIKILIKNRRKIIMRVKIKVENEKLKFNVSEKQALLLVKIAKEFEEVYMSNVLATLDDADSEAEADEDEEAQDETEAK